MDAENGRTLTLLFVVEVDPIRSRCGHKPQYSAFCPSPSSPYLAHRRLGTSPADTADLPFPF